MRECEERRKRTPTKKCGNTEEDLRKNKKLPSAALAESLLHGFPGVCPFCQEWVRSSFPYDSFGGEVQKSE